MQKGSAGAVRFPRWARIAARLSALPYVTEVLHEEGFAPA
jgi:hypothetical protein